MSLLKKLAGETALYGLSSIVGRFLNYLLVPLHTRVFTTDEFGVVGELYAYTGFLMVIFSYRMETAFFRYGTPEPDRDRAYSTAVFSLFGTTFWLAALIFLFAQPIANLTNYPSHPEYFRWFGLILAFDSLAELPFARLRLEQRPIRFVIGKLLWIGLNIGLNFFWLVFCPWASQNGWTWVHSVWSPKLGVGYVFLANLLASAVVLAFLAPQLLAAFQAHFDRKLWKTMIKYAAPLVIVGFAGIANEMLDRAMMTRLLPGSLEENRSQLGIYSANYKLAMLISLFTQAYRYAAEPFFFKNALEKDALDTQAKATKWFTIAACAGMVGIVLFLDVLQFFVGKQFRSGLNVVPILLLANVLLGVYYNFSVWYRLKDRTGTGALIALGGAAITLILNVLWVPSMGYVGAAWATLACYFFMAGVTWFAGRELHPVPYPLLRMAMHVGAATALAGVYFFCKKWLPGLSVWGVGLSAALFTAYLVGVYFFEKNDLKKGFGLRKN